MCFKVFKVKVMIILKASNSVFIDSFVFLGPEVTILNQDVGQKYSCLTNVYIF